MKQRVTWWARTKEVWVQRQCQVRRFPLLPVVSWSPPLSPSFTVQTPPHLLLAVLPLPSPTSAELTQSDRACRALCARFVCVCTSLWMCECETIAGRWVTPLSVSCMLLICFDWWLSPIQTTHLKAKKKYKKLKPPLLLLMPAGLAAFCGAIVFFYCILFYYCMYLLPNSCSFSHISSVWGEATGGGAC